MQTNERRKHMKNDKAKKRVHISSEIGWGFFGIGFWYYPDIKTFGFMFGFWTVEIDW